jgi:hypothetical protein
VFLLLFIAIIEIDKIWFRKFATITLVISQPSKDNSEMCFYMASGRFHQHFRSSLFPCSSRSYKTCFLRWWRISLFFVAKLCHFTISIFYVCYKTLKLNSENRKTKKKSCIGSAKDQKRKNRDLLLDNLFALKGSVQQKDSS